MKSVLVLGGTQFFGMKLVLNLLNKGWNVTIATRGRANDPFGDWVKRIVLDREDTNSISTHLSGRSWDLVFDQTCQSPQEALDACQVFDGMVGHYVFTSTMAVYDHGVNLREEDFIPREYPTTIKPRSNYVGVRGYQEAKRASEGVFAQRTSFRTTMVRFPLVIGPDDYTRRLEFHVDRVCSGRAIGLPNPNIRLSFISSDTAARFLEWVADNEMTGPINAGALGDISLSELCTIVEQETRKQSIIVPTTEPEHLSPYAYDDSWSLDVSIAANSGFHFADVTGLMRSMVQHYVGRNM